MALSIKRQRVTLMNVKSLLFCIILSVLLIPVGVKSITLDDLINGNELFVNTYLENKGQLVVRQEITLVIELKSNRWFAGGTTIRLPEIADVIVTQREQFAENSSFNESDISWTIQRWRISLFPQKAGVITIPPLAVMLKVNHEKSGNISGTIQTSAIDFKVEVPDGISLTERWLAAENFELERTWEPLDFHSKQGESLRMKITQTAQGVLPMMLTPVKFESPEYLAAYYHPPKFENISHRGENRAVRVDTIDFSVEKEGEFIIPEIRLNWWDTGNHEFKTVTIPGLLLSPNDPVVEGEFGSSGFNAINNAVFLLLVVFLFTITIYIYRLIQRYQRKVTLSTELTEKNVLRKYNQSIRDKNWVIACRWLYYWLDHFSTISKKEAGEGNLLLNATQAQKIPYNPLHVKWGLATYAGTFDNPELNRLVKSLMQAAYFNVEPESQSDFLKITAELSKNWLKRLKFRLWFKPDKIDIRLNP